MPEAQLPSCGATWRRDRSASKRQPPNDGPRRRRAGSRSSTTRVDQTTGTIKVKGTFANEDRRLWPGQFVNVDRHAGDRSDARSSSRPSPSRPGQQGQYVFVVKADQTVEMRPVTVARTIGGETVIASGLKAGETVVTDGHLRLVAGQPRQHQGRRRREVAP